MKDKGGYIAAVLSHITSKRQKEAVSDELWDHMIEKGNRLRSLGCSDEEIPERTESEMGDADVVGEQFERIGNSKVYKNIFYTVIAFLSFLLTFVVLVYGFEMDSVFCYRSYVLWFAGFVSVLINLFIALRKKLIFNAATFLCGLCFIVIFWQGLYMPDFIKLLPGNTERIKNTFFNSWYSYAEMDYMVSHKIFAAGLCVFLIFIAVSVIAMRVRIDFLKNTREDYIFCDVLSVLCAVSIFVSALLFFSVSAQVITIRNNLYNEVRTQLEEIDDFIITNLDAVAEIDDTHQIKEKFEELLSENGYKLNDYDEYVCNDSGIYVSMNYQDSDNEFSLQVMYSLYDLNGNDFNFFDKNDLLSAKEYSENEAVSIYAAPRPAFLEYCKDNSSVRLFLSYSVPKRYSNNNDNYENCITYIYEDGEFKKAFSDFITETEEVELTEKQTKALEAALLERYGCNDYIRKIEQYTDVDYRIYPNIYGAVKLNNSNVYEVYFEPYSCCLITIDDVLYDLGGGICDVMALKIRFDSDSKAAVLEEWFPLDGNLYAKSIKEKFIKKAYEKWSAQDDSFTSGNKSAIEAEYKKKISGDLITFNQDTGEYEITEFTDNGMPTDNVTRGRLEKRAG